jgi:hypothetical protein
LETLHRSLPRLQKSLDCISVDSRETRKPYLSATELAMCWKDGLRLLVPMGFSVLDAIEIACGHADTASVSLLLESPTAIFAPSSPIFEYAGRSTNFIVHRLVFNEFHRRRTSLTALALQHLSTAEIDELDLRPGKVLERNARYAYDLLNQRISVPNKLDCLVDPYSCVRFSGDGVHLLDLIYNTGYIQTESLLPSLGRTAICHQLHRAWNYIAYGIIPSSPEPFPSLQGIIWLLNHGASPRQVGARHRGPTVFFSLTQIYRVWISKQQTYPSWDQVASYVQDDVHLLRDDCDCSCGTGGCLPTYLL